MSCDNCQFRGVVYHFNPETRITHVYSEADNSLLGILMTGEFIRDSFARPFTDEENTAIANKLINLQRLRESLYTTLQTVQKGEVP